MTEPGNDIALAQGSGDHLGLGLSIDDTPELGPWLLPGL
jgi:hypothetical protein